jgi:acyl transferase domain-containing protein
LAPSARNHRRDAIAIVGIACRVPGADDASQLWELLRAGRDTIGGIPSERFDIERWFDPKPGRPDRISTRFGGFLSGIDKFDAAFFGLSRHEAVRLDPQHRLMMESAWEAIEDAGVDAARLAGSRTGVYSSCLASDYWDFVRLAGMYDMDAASGTGAWGMPAARISRSLDLRGPSIGIEAACSSSLLGVHLACQDLWSGQTELALVSSASLLLAPDHYLGLSEAEMLSPSGRCRFGEATADGYVRSEGVVTVLLKPLEAAVRDHDRVYATIIGSAANNNGGTSDSILATSVSAQEDMLRTAYRDAGVAPSEVDYVEAHGPGTPGGDQVELRALAEVVGAGREKGHPCLLGSVKSNVGHTEAVAGLVGLVKTALAIHNRRVPATLHVRTPHPLLAAADGGLALATEDRPWPDTGRPALAGVSSFGLNATNVHVVLRAVAPPTRLPRQGQRQDQRQDQRHRAGAVLLPLSARHPEALGAVARRWADRLAADPTEVADLAFTAGARRTHHPHRVAVTGTDAARLAAELRAFADGRAPESVLTGTGALTGTGRPRTVFVFPGQGAQWVGMGRDLLAANATFRATLAECDRAIRREAGWSLLELLAGDDPLDDVDRVQPALFAIQVGLAAVWRDWGVEPDLLIGHSMGEVAAACVSGALSIEQGAAVICRRAELIVALPAPGAMVAVQVGEAAARAAIGEYADRVEVGVVNSSQATVLAGDREALAAIVENLRADGVFCREVNVQYASHSPQVDPVRADLLAALADVTPGRANIVMHSTLRGRPLEGTELDAEYWTANLREPVRFGDAVLASLAGGRPTLFVEISPHPLLVGAIEDAIIDTGAPGVVIGSLTRDEPDVAALLGNLGAAYVNGCEPAWEAVLPEHRFVPDLPRYPWQHDRYWVDGPRAATVTEPVVDDEQVLTLEAVDALSWLNSVREGAAKLTGTPGVVLERLRVPGEPPGTDHALRVELRAVPDGWRFDVRVGVPAADGLSTWRRYASGQVRAGTGGRDLEDTRESIDLLRQWCTESVDRVPGSGLRELWRRDGESVGALESATFGGVDLLAVCVAALRATVPSGQSAFGGVVRAAEMRFAAAPADVLWVHARLHRIDPTTRAVTGDVRLLDAGHRTVAEVRELVLSRVETVEQPVRPAGPDVIDHREFSVLLAELLQVPVNGLDPTVRLAEAGMTSLLATRLRGRLARAFGVHLSLQEMLAINTIGDLVEELNGQAWSRRGETQPV